jgi:hypothetical protein
MLVLALIACRPDAGDLGLPTLGEADFVVPGDGLPDEVVLQEANNNLGVVMHEGRRYLAWRTAPSHFASPETTMWVVSSEDGVSWDFEASVALGTDVREMQFLSWEGDLWLYFAVLGDNPLDFEPQGMRMMHLDAPGDWSEPVEVNDPTFIPWRTKVLDGKPSMIGYVGGENVYEPDGEPIRVQWLTTTDGATFTPYLGGDDPVVHEGGASETDIAFLDDGSLVAVLRNEAGEGNDFGSKICTAPAADLAAWTCSHDKRKFDSPLVFTHGGSVWLIGRRNVTDDGFYDLDEDELSHADQYLRYQGAYWFEPKRCSLWKVDPTERSVAFVLDLPSRGDTCFPDALDLGDGLFEVWNYTSPPDGPDIDWIDGQNGTTGIYRIDLTFPR